MTTVIVDARCANLELDRLKLGFTTEDHLNFARILFANYVRTQADVHIETGSLRASGTAEVDVARDHRWEGNISYGGASFGVNNPVKYAIYEIYSNSARYGGNHDYFRTTHFIEDEYMGAITTYTARGNKLPHPEGHVR